MKPFSTVLAFIAALCSGGFAQTWTNITTGTSSKIYTVFFVNQDLGWIGGEGSMIRKTTNGGSTWTAQSGSRNITAIRFQNANNGWAVGGSGGVGVALKTTNGGTTWTTQISGGTVLWDVNFLDSSRGWVAGAGGAIQRTINAGVNWTTITSGTTTDLRRMWFEDSTTFWVVGSAGLIRKTTNGGSTWAVQTSGTTNNMVDIRFPTKDTGWCVGVGGVILKTVNGGTNWVAQNSGTTQTLLSVAFLNTHLGYITGDGGLLLKTTNGGDTWVPQTTGVTYGLNNSQFLSENVAYLVGDNGTMVKTSSPFPAGLTYSKNPAEYNPGSPITANVPSITGTGPFTYSASTPLPAGLTLDPNTGSITGTPTTPSPTTGYVISATNLYGTTTATLNIGIVTPPSGLAYSVFPAPQYTVGTAITPNTPTVSGTVSRYTVVPALPAGLILDSASGTISGTPSVPSASTNYTITAGNGAGGSTSIVLNITVLLKPSGLTYSTNPGTYLAGTAIAPNTPTIQGSGPFTYSVSPALPAGLTLNGLNGIISGTPANETATAYYTVTASNGVGSTISILAISVTGSSAIAPRAGIRVQGFQSGDNQHSRDAAGRKQKLRRASVPSL